MKCPNCNSDRVEYMDEDLKSVDGKYYSHECMTCGSFFTRNQMNEQMKVGRQVLMEGELQGAQEDC